MAQIFKPAAKKTALPSAPVEVEIESLDHFSQGVARYQNRVLFIAGALPSERVQVRITQLKRKVAQGKLLSVLTPSPKRITPHCAHFSSCGGCSLQMLALEEQLQVKQRNLQLLFKKFAGIELTQFEPVVSGLALGYRRRARLHFQQNRKTGELSFGFKKRASNDLVFIESCPVLVDDLSGLIAKLRTLFSGLQARKQLGHLELYQGEQRPLIYLRLTAKLGKNDLQRLLAFALEHQLDISYKIAEQAVASLTGSTELSYPLPTFDLQLSYRPGDFIQVNEQVNQLMVEQAVNWLKPNKDERLLDLFCGIGNFSLPLAQQAKQVLAIEGVAAMVAQAKANAEANGISNVEFITRNLDHSALPADIGQIDKVLLDPARPGAFKIMAEIVKLKPKALVYVSCNPVTLCRDSRILLDAGYQLNKLALIDMFPDTEHIETMVLFLKN